MMMETKKQVVIIGAGPAGLAAAYSYRKKGYEVVVIERSAEVGGLARGFKFGQEKYDLGPHSFFTNYSENTKAFLNQFIGAGNYSKKPLVKLMQTRSALFYNPFRFSSLKKYGNLQFFLLYILYRLKAFIGNKNHANSLEKHGDWMRDKIFRPYCLKYFNLPSEEVSNDFVNLLYTNRSKGEEASVYVPNEGYLGKLWENLYEYLKRNNVKFLLNDEVLRVNIENGTIREIHTNNEVLGEIGEVISSLPHEVLFKLVFPNREYNVDLKFRSTILFYIEIEELNTDALYLTNYDALDLIGRISFCDNWKIQTNQKVISVEIWCDNDDAIYRREDADLLRQILISLKKVEFIKVGSNPNFRTIRLPNSYPVLKKNVPEELERINKQFETISNLQLVGRHGKFMWDGIDDIINATLNE
jgi:N,N'-diacetyllegionaminate synthase